MKCYCWRNGAAKCKVCLTRERAEASTLEITIGHVYEAAKPKPIKKFLFDKPLWNDRQVKWISSDRGTVQYDGPAVANGRHYPRVSMDAFKAWAGKDITDAMPDNERRAAS